MEGSSSCDIPEIEARTIAELEVGVDGPVDLGSFNLSQIMQYLIQMWEGVHLSRTDRLMFPSTSRPNVEQQALEQSSLS